MLNNYIIMQKYRMKLKFIFLLIIYLSFNFMCFSQNPIGAWERYYEDENGTNIRSVVIFSEKFQSIAKIISTVNLKKKKLLLSTNEERS